MTKRRGLSKTTIDMIRALQEITEAAAPITVRGVAYEAFTIGLIPSMEKKNVAKVSRWLTTAREHGLIPWAWIVDETREAERVQAWTSPDEIINAAVRGYRRDYWRDQPAWCEVWSEKGTVRGVLAPVLRKYGVTFRVMHGFGSATAIHDVADETVSAERELQVLYVGDIDPSGLYMSEIDLPERLLRYGGFVDIQRIALNADDINRGLPSFEASTKRNDPRYRWFVANHGGTCWELDAMDPNDLRDRVEQSINDLIDQPAWKRAIEVEAAEVASMKEFHAAWQSKLNPGSICSGGLA